MKITIFIVLIVLILFFILVIGYFRFIHYRNLSKETFSENRNRVAIITSIYGNYDDLKIQNIKNKDLIDWYCFTDNKGVKSDTWKIINTPYHLLNEKYEHKNYKNSFSTLVKNENSKKTLNMMSAKYYKMKGHEIDILKNYEYFIWMDGSLFLRDNFITNIYELIKKNYNLINFKHTKRNNIKDEIDASLFMGKYNSQNLTEQYNEYILSGFPDNIGLTENTMSVRKNTETINKLYDDWWLHNLKYSFQDQVSYPYVIWKNGIYPDYIINDYVFNNNSYCFSDYTLMKNH
jgi:hypothetical protein